MKKEEPNQNEEFSDIPKERGIRIGRRRTSCCFDEYKIDYSRRIF